MPYGSSPSSPLPESTTVWRPTSIAEASFFPEPASELFSMYGRMPSKWRTKPCAGTDTARPAPRLGDVTICVSPRDLQIDPADRESAWRAGRACSWLRIGRGGVRHRHRTNAFKGPLSLAAHVWLLVFCGALEIFPEFLGSDLTHHPRGRPPKRGPRIFDHPFHEFVDARLPQSVQPDKGVAHYAIVLVVEGGAECGLRLSRSDPPQAFHGARANPSIFAIQALRKPILVADAPAYQEGCLRRDAPVWMRGQMIHQKNQPRSRRELIEQVERPQRGFLVQRRLVVVAPGQQMRQPDIEHILDAGQIPAYLDQLEAAEPSGPEQLDPERGTFGNRVVQPARCLDLCCRTQQE